MGEEASGQAVETSPMASGRTRPGASPLESAMSVERPMQVAAARRHGALEDDAYHRGKRLQRVVVVEGCIPSRSHVRPVGPREVPLGAVRTAPCSAASSAREWVGWGGSSPESKQGNPAQGCGAEGRVFVSCTGPVGRPQAARSSEGCLWAGSH